MSEDDGVVRGARVWVLAELWKTGLYIYMYTLFVGW